MSTITHTQNAPEDLADKANGILNNNPIPNTILPSVKKPPTMNLRNFPISKYSLIIGYCTLCYNITYKSPPMVRMTAGGLEPPKPQATEFQARPVCHFQHAVSFENLDGESLPAETPSKLPCLKRYHILGDLSRVIC